MEPFLTAFSLQYHLILSGNHEILEINLLSTLHSVAFTFGIHPLYKELKKVYTIYEGYSVCL